MKKGGVCENSFGPVRPSAKLNRAAKNLNEERCFPEKGTFNYEERAGGGKERKEFAILDLNRPFLMG